MNDYILWDNSVVDCALSHNLKGCLQEHSFQKEMIYMFVVMGRSFPEIRQLFTAHMTRDKSQESSVLNVNPGCTFNTNNKYKVNITRLSDSGFCLKIVQSEASKCSTLPGHVSQ